MGLLDGRVSIVTGGSSGIGRATALSFAREGAVVVVADLQTEEGQGTVGLVKEAGGDGIFVKTDVSRSDDVREMVEKTIKMYGRLDFAFNNAGISQPPKALADQPEELFEKVVGVNLKGVWLCMKYEIPYMLKNTTGGAIVNTSSVAGLVGFAGVQIYSASKHAVIGLTKSAALEYAKSGIRINAVAPGVIHTKMIEDFIHMAGDDPKLIDSIRAAHPMGRDGKPDEVANAAVWLCSDKASFVTGTVLTIDGGYTAW